MRAMRWVVLGVTAAVFAWAAAAPASKAAAPPAADPKAGEAAGTAAAPSFDEVMKDPNRKVGFLRKTLRTAGGERIYQVWVPLAYTADRKWPVILFLHGAGECGTDGEKMLGQGLPKEIKSRQGKFDFIVVIPQCPFFAIVSDGPPAPDGLKPKFKGGWRDREGEIAIEAFQATLREYACDSERLYLTGLSMGGFGTFDLAMRHPKTFVAIVPVCGGADLARAREIAALPAWVWHGDADTLVPPDNSRKMVEALKQAGAAEVKYTELPGVGHNAWDPAYASDDLWTWLLEHRRAGARKVPAAKEPPAQPPPAKAGPAKTTAMRPMTTMTPMEADKFRSMEKGKFRPMEPVRPLRPAP